VPGKKKKSVLLCFCQECSLVNTVAGLIQCYLSNGDANSQGPA